MKAHEKCKEMARHAFQLQLQSPPSPRPSAVLPPCTCKAGEFSRARKRLAAVYDAASVLGKELQVTGNW